MRIVIFVLLLSALVTVSHAAELSPSVEREIAMLLDALGTSDCRFYRNGSWHSASDAQAHLTRKYEYLRKKKLSWKLGGLHCRRRNEEQPFRRTVPRAVWSRYIPS